MIYVVLKNNVSVHECTSLRMAKEFAKKNGANIVLQLSLDVNLELQKLHITAVYYWKKVIGVFVKFSYEEYLYLIDKHLI